MNQDQADNTLWNPDLAPTTAAQRTWKARHFAALWLGMVIAVPAYMLAAGLIEQGMSATQAVWAVLLGNVIVLIPMLLIAMRARNGACPMRCWRGPRSAGAARGPRPWLGPSSPAAGTASRPGSAAERC